MRKLLLALLLMPALCLAEVKPECVYACDSWDYMRVYRIYIPSGWVVLSHVNYGYVSTYVPDAKHEWKV